METAMDPVQLQAWREADQALDRLLDLAPDQRIAHLAGLPAALRGRVEALLRAHEAPGLLDHGIALGSDDIPTRDPGDNTRIGPWTTTGLIGCGGMALVHAAHRELSGGVQHAALKMLTTAALAGEGRERFLREHQALARLAHPRIAALLDAGVLPDGTPWLAMQRVLGERIDTWCDTRALGPRAVVELFLQVCDAVAHANRLLVVHRDLKPSNLLVDEEGEVRLLDFGIARLLDETRDHGSSGTGARALTPQYAAPEQFDGSDAGTSVDVYGLGAVLYRLMTGAAPREDAAQMRELPMLPSRKAREVADAHLPRRRRMQRALHGDLDAILCKALALEPAQRYPDAAALAADLRRWLQQRPVEAVPPRLRYRAARFVLRHRGAVVAGSLLAVAIGAGLTAAWWQSQRIAREAARAEQVKGFLVELLQSASPEGPDGRSEDTADVLARGAHRAMRSLDADPGLQAELLVLIGRLQAELGRFEAAEVTLDAAAVQLSGSLASDSLQAELALARAQSASAEGRPTEMREVLEQARNLSPEREGAGGLRLAAALRLRLAYALSQLGQHEEAARRIEEAAAFATRIRPEDANLEGDVHFYRAQAAMMRDADDEAWDHLQRARDAHARSSRRDEALEASVMSAMATVAGRTGRTAEALALSRDVVAITRRLYPPGHPLLGGKLAALAQQLAVAGRLDEAEPLSREALDIRRQTLSPDSVRLASSIYNHAMLLLDLEQAQAALPLLQEAHAIAEQGYGVDDFRTLLVATGQLYAHVAVGPRSEARRIAIDLEHRLLALGTANGALTAPEASALGRVARAWLDLGDPARTLRLLDAPEAPTPASGTDAALYDEALRLHASMQVAATSDRSAVAARLRAMLQARGPDAIGRAAAEAYASLGHFALSQGEVERARLDLAAAHASIAGTLVPARTQAQLDALETALR
jgi:tetratricopeptide (TPR) repeat protein